MSALKQPYPTVTKQEYFNFREHREGKFELHDGTILVMAGGCLPHNRIEIAVTTQLSLNIDTERCETFGSNQSVGVEEYGNYYYPDAIVVCGEVQVNEKDNILNPILIVEVLSRSTALYDRNTKFERYKTIPTLKYYLLVSQDTPRIEVFTRAQDADEWAETVVESIEAELNLPLFLQHLSLAKLYAKVAFT